MGFLLATDIALFRFVNQTLANPVFDWVMPRLAGHPLFIPASLIAGLLLLWKGGKRARLFALFLPLVIALSDGLVCNSLKKLSQRPRPCNALADARVLIGRSKNPSMPSAHAANWFAVAALGFIFYRRSWRWLLPVAATIGFARIYDGVHYPSDVLVGAILGIGTAVATVTSADGLWRWIGSRWFPVWWQRLPSLVRFSESGAKASVPVLNQLRQVSLEAHWLRLGYLFIAGWFVFRLVYIGSDTIELSKDEAYQWLWSKHLALSYYSKPPGIALIQFAGTSLWGDTQFGIRFFSPVFAAALSLVLLRFLSREVPASHAFIFLVILSCIPLLSIGTILMTIDPPLVVFWTIAMLAGWRALQPDGATRHWLLAGLATGLGFLSKYTAAYLIVCWALFFLLWPPARAHLRKPGPWLLLLIFALSTVPVIIWNSQHGWITARHVASNAQLGKAWKPTLRFLFEFVGGEFVLLNPVLFVGATWAMITFWKCRPRNPLWLYFFCLGWPVFFGHLAYSLHSRIQLNWIAPAVIPMLCLMLGYWSWRYRARSQEAGLQSGVEPLVEPTIGACDPSQVRWLKPWLIAGIVFGLIVSVVLHESNVVASIIGHSLPGPIDPLRRVRAWKETAAVVEQARQQLLQEGKPTFIIAEHYGMTGLFSFYIPAAKAAVRAQPLVYCKTSAEPNNQLFFWPEYRYAETRVGQNAIYVNELGPYPPEKGWLWKWLSGKRVGSAKIPPPPPPNPMLLQQFASVTDLGVFEVKVGSRVLRHVQLLACRDLR